MQPSKPSKSPKPPKLPDSPAPKAPRQAPKTQAFLAARPWCILAAGALIQILTGIPASWGVFQKPVMEEYGFSQQAASFVLSFTVGAFGLGCVLGGYLQDRRGPRITGFCGTALLAGGFVLAGLVPAGAAGLFYLAFSLPVGLGSAFLYPAVMSCAQKWYRDKKGLATGIIGGAVGLSGAVLTALVRWLSGGWGIRVCFGALAGLMLAVCGLGSLLLADPPPPKQKPSEQGRGKQQPPFDIPPKQMLRTPQYWLGFATVALATPAVLLFSPIIVQLGAERGLSENAAHLSVVLGSVGSAAGRLLMPMLSDRIGRRAADAALFAALAGLSLAFWQAQGWWVVLVYALLTFCYSGEAAVLPALSSDLFGLPHAGVNYGFLALGMSAGSIGFPLLAVALGLEAGRHFIAIGAALAGLVCCLLLRPTQGEKL